MHFLNIFIRISIFLCYKTYPFEILKFLFDRNICVSYNTHLSDWFLAFLHKRLSRRMRVNRE